MRTLLTLAVLMLYGASFRQPREAFSISAGLPLQSDLALRLQAEQAHQVGHFREEAEFWKQFQDRAPLPEEACPAIGLAYERAREPRRALAAYERCLSLNPDDVDSLVAYAHLLEMQSDLPRASELYGQGLKKFPDNPDVLIGLARIQLRQDHVADASKAAKQVLLRSPQNSDALLVAGIAAWRQSQLEEAKQYLQRGAALHNKDSEFHSFLGRIAEAEQHPKEALEEYTEALSINPNAEGIAELRKRLLKVP